MAIKAPKMVQITQILDHWCILMVFIGFQKIFEKFQKLVILPPKNGNFTRFSRRFFGTRSSTEKASTPPQMLQMSLCLVKMFLRVVTLGFCMIFYFS